jgi:hypothetical protein
MKLTLAIKNDEKGLGSWMGRSQMENFKAFGLVISNKITVSHRSDGLRTEKCATLFYLERIVKWGPNY